MLVEKIPVFLIMYLLISCAPTKIDQTVTFESGPAVKIDNREAILSHYALKRISDSKSTPATVQRDRTKFSTAGQIQNYMEFLASDKLQGRDTGSEGLEKAAEFLEYNFQKNNIAP